MRLPATGRSNGSAGNSHTDTYQVPYDYYICTVTLENFNLSHVPVYVIGLSLIHIFYAAASERIRATQAAKSSGEKGV